MLNTLRPALMLLAATTTLAAVGPATATISPDTTGTPRVHPRGCVYFQQADFQGARGLIMEHEDLDLLGRRWDNQISSIHCAASCRLNAWDEDHYDGETTRLSGSVRALGDEWNDRISSMAVRCRESESAENIQPAR